MNQKEVKEDSARLGVECASFKLEMTCQMNSLNPKIVFTILNNNSDPNEKTLKVLACMKMLGYDDKVICEVLKSVMQYEISKLQSSLDFNLKIRRLK